MTASFGHEGDRLSAFLDDELDDRDALAVTRHLDRCDECTAELAELRSTSAVLRSLPTPTPSLSWMVETAVLGPGDRTRRTGMLVTAAAAVAVLGVTYLLGGDTGSVQPPVDSLVVDHVRSVQGGPVVVPVRLERANQDGG